MWSQDFRWDFPIIQVRDTSSTMPRWSPTLSPNGRNIPLLMSHPQICKLSWSVYSPKTKYWPLTSVGGMRRHYPSCLSSTAPTLGALTFHSHSCHSKGSPSHCWLSTLLPHIVVLPSMHSLGTVSFPNGEGGIIVVYVLLYIALFKTCIACMHLSPSFCYPHHQPVGLRSSVPSQRGL